MAVDEAMKQAMGKALGRVTSGVFVVSAAHEGKVGAILGSWVQQAAFEPPAISLAIAKGRAVGAMITGSRRLALSVLGEHDVHLMKRFARGVSPEEEAFAGISTRLTAGGLPVLADALAYLEGRLVQVCDFGADHELFIAEVTDGQVLKEGRAFMHQRGSGFHY